jgi:UDPglucose 6-dehydrogenase
MKVGIVGLGFVGGATREALRSRLHEEPVGFDPVASTTPWSCLLGCDLVFICVPTPESADGSCNTHIVEMEVGRLAEVGFKGTVIIKSTTPPTTIRALQEKYPDLDLATNPEFLTQRRAEADAMNPPQIVLGVTNRNSARLRQFFGDAFFGVPIRCLSPEGAMLAKYCMNNYYATAVTLANEFYRLAHALGVPYAEVRGVMEGHRTPETQGPVTHMSVPGPDGKFGYGGACFPKDVAALLAEARGLHVPTAVLQAVQTENEGYHRGYTPKKG